MTVVTPNEGRGTKQRVVIIRFIKGDIKDRVKVVAVLHCKYRV